MSLEMAAQIIGLVGDVVTFSGAIVLAIREAGEGQRAIEVEGTTKVLSKYPEMQKLTIQIDEVIVRDEGDVEIGVAGRSSRRARLGAGIIAVGFLFLLVSRALEMLLVS